MKRRSVYAVLAVLGALAYGLFLLLQWPAANLANRWLPSLPGAGVETVSGTLTSGTARAVRWRGLRVETLSWRLHRLPLLLGRLEYGLFAEEPAMNVEGVVAVGIDRRLRDLHLRGRIPLEKLTVWTGGIDARGLIDLDDVALRWDRQGRPRAATGSVRLRGVRLELGRPLELGDFTADLSIADTNLVATLGDAGGPLELSGTLTLTPEGSYRCDSRIAVRDNNNQELRQVLSLVGKPRDDGSWSLIFSGTLNVTPRLSGYLEGGPTS